MAQVQATPIACLRYNGAAPPPQAADVSPSPYEQWKLALVTQEQKDAAKVEAANAPPKDEGFMSKAGSLFNKAAASVDQAFHQGTAAAEKQIYQMEQDNGQKEWTVQWPELASSGDAFVVRYSCAVLSAGKLSQGVVFLSEKHVSFKSNDGTLKDSLPLASVASLQKSVALNTVNNGPPFIQVIPAPTVVPDCCQFFFTETAQNKLWQFVDFDSVGTKGSQMLGSGVVGTACERFANWADKSWRKSTAVPVPGVQYASF